MKVLFFISVLLLSGQISAQPKKLYQGKYTIKWAWARTMEISRQSLNEKPQQQGQFKIVLEKYNWSSLSEQQQKETHKTLVIKGVISGKFDPKTGYTNHIFSNKKRNGLLYSVDDILIPISGDYACSTGQPMQANELINFATGSGIYKNLIGGNLTVTAIINTCQQHPKYRQNNFFNANKDGYLLFSSPNT